MNEQRENPSPLAGEGAARRRRGAGEGALSLTKAARGLRSRMTDAERKLWFALKDRRFAAFKFRRQVPVGPYITDFLYFESRLVVEVSKSGGSPDKSGNGVEQNPSPVVSLARDATLSRKGRGEERDRAMSLLVPKLLGAW
jgi:hypothetical protein